MWKNKLEELRNAEGIKFKEYANNQKPTKEAIQKLQFMFNHKVPKALIDFMQELNGFSFEGLDGIEYEFFSAVQIWHRSLDNVVEYRVDNEDDDALHELRADSKLKKLYWNEGGWIAIGESSIGEAFFIDLDPSKGGTKGQVGTFFVDDPVRKVVGSSLDTWFSSFVDRYLREQKKHLDKQKEEADKPKKEEKKPWWKR